MASLISGRSWSVAVRLVLRSRLPKLSGAQLVVTLLRYVSLRRNWPPWKVRSCPWSGEAKLDWSCCATGCPKDDVELGVLGQAACAWVFADSKELTGPGGPGGQCTKFLVYRLCTSACSQRGSSADLRGTSFGQCTAPVPLAGSGSNPGLTTGAAPAERCECPGQGDLVPPRP